jgi:hypothetical protein
MLALRRDDPVLSSASRWEDFEATAQGSVLEVSRRRGTMTRRLVANFGNGDHVVAGARGGRVLFTSGTFDPRLGKLGAESAIVLDA